MTTGNGDRATSGDIHPIDRSTESRTRVSRRRDRHPRRRASAARRSTSSCRICAIRPSPATAPDGNCRVCMVEIEGERVLAASCIRTPTPGMKVKTQTDRAKTARQMVAELLLADQPAHRLAHDPRIRTSGRSAKRQNIEAGRFPKRDAASRARPQPSGHGGQSRRLHPVQSLRPRLPRGAGQRRDRHGRPRPRRKDRVRLRRPDGRFDLRRLRRMRAGLPDRRADAGDPGRRRTTSAPDSPTARSTASAPIAASAASSPIRSRTTSCLSVTGRDGPANQNRLCVKGRFGFDYVTNPQRLMKPMVRKDGVPKIRRRPGRSGQPVDAFPRSDLGRGDGARRCGPEKNPRPRRRRARWPASARPRARTKRPICSRSWCAPASAPTMSITARGFATPRRWRRCSKASARRR